MRERVLFFDLLRCVAAVAVIAIHVLAPYRDGLGVIPFDHWVTAVSVNSVTRWAVPVFILISGALMLSDDRPFNASYYVRRRLGKVLIPFLLILWHVRFPVHSACPFSYNFELLICLLTHLSICLPT